MQHENKDGWGQVAIIALASVVTGAIWLWGNILLNRIALAYINLELGGHADHWIYAALSTVIDPATAAALTEAVWWGLALAPSALQQYARKRWRVALSTIAASWVYGAGATVVHLLDILLPALGVVIMFDLWMYLNNPYVIAALLVFGFVVSIFAQNTMLDTAGEATGMVFRLVTSTPSRLSRNLRAARLHHYRTHRTLPNRSHEFAGDEAEGGAA